MPIAAVHPVLRFLLVIWLLFTMKVYFEDFGSLVRSRRSFRGKMVEFVVQLSCRRPIQLLYPLEVHSDGAASLSTSPGDNARVDKTTAEPEDPEG